MALRVKLPLNIKETVSRRLPPSRRKSGRHKIFLPYSVVNKLRKESKFHDSILIDSRTQERNEVQQLD